MSTETNQDQEIDLGVLLQRINKSISNLAFSLFKFFLFLRKNIITLVLLLVIGITFGYLIDQNSKKYYSEIIVCPNFGSTEYMYSKVDLLSTKLKDKNQEFLQSIGVKTPEKIISIEVTPVIDIYSLINHNTQIATNAQNTQNFEMMKLLAESSDINKVIEDKITSRNYPFHTIKIITNKTINNKDVVEPILKFLNNNAYFNVVQKTFFKNTEEKIKKNRETIQQIDVLLNEFSATSSNSTKNDKLVYYNENTQLNDIILSKNRLVEETASQEIFRINYSKTIKDTALILNNLDRKGMSGKVKLILPVLLIFSFLFFQILKVFYQSQKKKLTQK